MSRKDTIPSFDDSKAVDLDEREKDKLARDLAVSLTHLHVLGVVLSKIDPSVEREKLTLLDAGSGNGLLIAYLQRMLRVYFPDFKIEIHGYDISDGGVQSDGYYRSTIARLSEFDPATDWEDRIKLISATDPWPFEDGRFDIVVSNQVGEHVANHALFFQENYRVQRPGGFSVHLFPLKYYIYEGHVRLPICHWFKQWDMKRRVIRSASLLGLGKWRKIRERVSVDDFSTGYADFLSFHCNYLSKRELLKVTRLSGFRAGFDYTREFYFAKVRDLFRLAPKLRYRRSLFSAMSVHFYMFLASVTLVLDKKDEYVNYIGKYVYGRE